MDSNIKWLQLTDVVLATCHGSDKPDVSGKKGIKDNCHLRKFSSNKRCASDVFKGYLWVNPC